MSQARAEQLYTQLRNAVSRGDESQVALLEATIDSERLYTFVSLDGLPSGGAAEVTRAIQQDLAAQEQNSIDHKRGELLDKITAARVQLGEHPELDRMEAELHSWDSDIQDRQFNSSIITR